MTSLFTELTEQEKMYGNPHYLQEQKKIYSYRYCQYFSTRAPSPVQNIQKLLDLRRSCMPAPRLFYES